ncbi:MAG: DnaA/Hda family protein [Fimbriimonadaceae bacterium]
MTGNADRAVHDGARQNASEITSDHSGFNTFSLLPSNVRAVEKAILFGANQARLVILVGPSGWGKTHLLKATSSLIMKADRTARPVFQNCSEGFSVNHMADHHQPLLLDDLQACSGRQRDRTMLAKAIERRIRSGHQTMLCLTANSLTCDMRQWLPYFHRWNIETIARPSTPEKRVLADHMARNEGITLGDPLLAVLANRLSGNGLTLRGALTRLRLYGDRWVTDEEILRAWGLLNPYFLDNGTWDMHQSLWELLVDRLERDHDTAIYVMRQVCGLPEDSLARYLEKPPSEIHRACKRVIATLQRGQDASGDMEKLLRRVVRRLS